MKPPKNWHLTALTIQYLTHGQHYLFVQMGARVLERKRVQKELPEELIYSCSCSVHVPKVQYIY